MKIQQRSSKKKKQKVSEKNTIGIDIGEQWSHYCVLDAEGEVIEEGTFPDQTRGPGQAF